MTTRTLYRIEIDGPAGVRSVVPYHSTRKLAVAAARKVGHLFSYERLRIVKSTDSAGPWVGRPPLLLLKDCP